MRKPKLPETVYIDPRSLAGEGKLRSYIAYVNAKEARREAEVQGDPPGDMGEYFLENILPAPTPLPPVKRGKKS